MFLSFFDYYEMFNYLFLHIGNAAIEKAKLFSKSAPKGRTWTFLLINSSFFWTVWFLSCHDMMHGDPFQPPYRYCQPQFTNVAYIPPHTITSEWFTNIPATVFCIQLVSSLPCYHLRIYIDLLSFLMILFQDALSFPFFFQVSVHKKFSYRCRRTV